MFARRTRRTVLPLAAVASVVASCSLFMPINPNPPLPQKSEESRPADTATKAPEPAPAETAKPIEPAPAVVTPPVVTTQPAMQPAPSPVVETPAPMSPVERGPRRIGKLSDANVAALLLASNNTDISYARLVASRSSRADVKEFARRMLTDHTGVNALVNDMLLKLDMGAEDTEASLDLRDESADNRDRMRGLSGFRFDSTYMENEIRYHRRFLSDIDDVLLPQVRNAGLRALITNIRPAVAAHLAHAEQVRADVLSKR